MSACRPIIFDTRTLEGAAALASLLAGTKTQERRVLAPQPAPEPTLFTRMHCSRPGYAGIAWMPTSRSGKTGLFTPTHYACPYGAPGDTLFVQEPWAVLAADGTGLSGVPLLSNHERIRFHASAAECAKDVNWRPPETMPRRASRLWLEVAEVEVARLSRVTDEDARAEGYFGRSARAAFLRDWHALHGDADTASDSSDPWVWVLTFRVLSAQGGNA